MHDRIKELKEQAMEWVPNKVDPDTKIRLLNAEKFAELIVKECATQFYLHGSRPEAHKVVLKHFGVEE